MDFRKAAWGISSCVVEKFLGERSGAPPASGSRGTVGQVCLTWWDPSHGAMWLGFGSSSQFQVQWEPWWSLKHLYPTRTLQVWGVVTESPDSGLLSGKRW